MTNRDKVSAYTIKKFLDESGIVYKRITNISENKKENSSIILK